MPPSSTLWKLDGHTVGKHRVLEAYLEAWLPIILMRFPRATFIDGFAGPGRYSGGERGSPIIAIDTYVKHSAKPKMTGTLDFTFFEKDRGRAEHLRQEVGSRRSSLPTGCDVNLSTGSFTDKMSELMDTLETQGRQDEPMFVMIDPFGVSDTPMNTISRILDTSRSEVYVSVMYRDINRFLSAPEFSEALDNLFGTHDWSNAPLTNGTNARKDFLYELYKKQLKEAGAKYVHHFDLYRENELVYALFFATKNELGSDRMKQAMWKVAPFGNLEFRSNMLNQMTFGSDILDWNDEIGRGLISVFGLNNQVSIEDLEHFMRSDRTLFHSGQLKDCLKYMEEQSKVSGDEGSRQRRKTFPPGTRLMFVEPPQLKLV